MEAMMKMLMKKIDAFADKLAKDMMKSSAGGER